MMKKIVCLMLVLSMGLGLAACGGSPAAATVSTAAPSPTEYTLPLEDGYNQVTFYWKYSQSIENADMWIWYEGQDGRGYVFTPWEHGGKVVLNVPESVTQIGYIVRRDCSDPGGSSWGSATKDYEQDRFAVVEGKQTVIYLKTGDASQYKSSDGGKTLDMAKKINIIGIADANKLEYKISPKTTITDLSQVKVFCEGKEVAVANLSSLGKETTSGEIELAEVLDLGSSYTVSIEGYGEQVAVPTAIFDSQYFADNYHYDGNDLGAVIHGDDTTFKVWAPTASKVVLNLF